MSVSMEYKHIDITTFCHGLHEFQAPWLTGELHFHFLNLSLGRGNLVK